MMITTNKGTKQEPSSPPVSLSPSPPPRVPSHPIQQDKRSSPQSNSNSNNKNESKQNPLLLLQQTCNSIGADLASNQICQNNIATITMTSNNSHFSTNNHDDSPKQYNRLKRSPTSSDDDLSMPSAKIQRDLKSYSHINNNNRQILVTPQIPSPITPDKNINYSNYTSKHQLIKQHHQMQQQQQQQQQNGQEILLPNNNYIEYTKPSKSPNKSPNLNKKSPINYQQNPHNIRSASPSPAKIPRVSSLPPPPAPTPTNSNGKINNNTNDGYYNNIRASSVNNPHLSVFYDSILTNMYPNQNFNLNPSKIDYANINAAMYAANIAQYNNSVKHNASTTPVNSLKRKSVSPVLPAQRINAALPNTMCPNPYCSQCLLTAATTAHISSIKKENDNICTVPGCTQCDNVILPKKYNDQHINSINNNLLHKQQNIGIHQCCWLVQNNTKCGKLFSTLEDLRAHVTAHTLDKEFLMIAANQSSHLIQQKHQQQMCLNNPKLSQEKHQQSDIIKTPNTVIEKLPQSELINQLNSNGLNHYYPYGQQHQQLITKNSNNKLSAFKPQQQLSKHHHHHIQQQPSHNHHLNPQLSYLQAQQNLYQNSNNNNNNNNLLLSQKLSYTNNNSSPYSSSYLNSLNAIKNPSLQTSTIHSGIQLAGGVPTNANDSIIYPYANHQYLTPTINPIYDIV